MPISTAPQETAIVVDGLGALKGWYNPADGTSQFFSIPYADVRARFAHSTLKSSWNDNVHDGRKLGAHSAQPERPFYPFPMPPRPHLGEARIDDFACCTLHVTCPAGTVADSKLPVIVFIHGGGFVFGTADYSILDGRPLANRSVELGMPTIIVTINYRVGFYGFLASEDIKADNAAFGGGNGNQGIVDQQNALLWINQHIAAFGGDPDRVLLTGQSAGAISVEMQMRGPQKDLFSTAILQSGTIPICGLYTEEEYHVIYVKLVKACGIDVNLPAPERLAALRSIPHEVLSQNTYEVFQALNLPQFGPCFDGYVLGAGVEIPRPHWYKDGKISDMGYKGRVVLGDCMHEGIIYDQSYRDYSPEHVISLVEKHLSADLAADTLRHYGITTVTTPRDLYLAIESLVTDGLFTAPPYLIAEANPDVFVYHWDHRSQFDNPWGGFAHHSLDYMWLFGGLKAILTPEENEMARSLQHDWIVFANGKTPYPSYSTSKNCRVYGPHSRTHTEDGSTYHERPTAWFDRIKNNLDAFDRLCTELIMRRSELVSSDYGPGTKHARKVTQGTPLAL